MLSKLKNLALGAASLLLASGMLFTSSSSFAVEFSSPVELDIILTSEIFGDPDFDFPSVQVTMIGDARYVRKRPGRTRNRVRTWDTEMLSMDLRAIAPAPPTGRFNVDSFFDITYRLSPETTGPGVLVRRGGGNFRVDSFFDIFVDIRVTDNSTGQVFEANNVHFDMCSSTADNQGRGTYSLRAATGVSPDGTTQTDERCRGKHRGHVTVLK